MKKKKKRSTPRIRPVEWLALTLVCAVAAILFWWQTSSRVLGQFETVCPHFNYQNCFKFYWQFHDYYQYLFIFTSLAALLFLTFFILSLKKPNTLPFGR